LADHAGRPACRRGGARRTFFRAYVLASNVRLDLLARYTDVQERRMEAA
jgi:hypothetical protein